MGFFTRTAMDMLMKTTHPEINRRQCWNLHPHRKPCTECKDICPYGDQIFTRPNLVKDWDPCTECGLCVSDCRSGCIIPSPEQVQRDTSAADTDNDTIWIGCEKSTRKNSMVRTCISALTWEILLLYPKRLQFKVHVRQARLPPPARTFRGRGHPPARRHPDNTPPQPGRQARCAPTR